ncbi:MAG TPA: biotin--[acetyl-CoA-carboxylase] ligase [Bryobacteraceae bacterium]|jgi:BirA family biotin operon repressor/biotin-[acetyl-CoA-carboxylase] ligase
MSLDLDRLRAAFRGRSLEYYPTLDSTMTVAAARPLGTIVVADEQTSGRGRHGHSWHSEPGAGIYVSLVLQPGPVLTLALGLATAEAIATVTGLACDLRWPNDVMIGGRKVAGILVELVNGLAIGGIGINVNQTAFPSSLAHEATSLRLQAGSEFSRTAILMSLVRAIETFQSFDKESILRLFTQASSYAAGRRVTVAQPEGKVEGVTAGLDASGYLVLRRDDGTDTLILAGGVRAAGS